MPNLIITHSIACHVMLSFFELNKIEFKGKIISLDNPSLANVDIKASIITKHNLIGEMTPTLDKKNKKEIVKQTAIINEYEKYLKCDIPPKKYNIILFRQECKTELYSDIEYYQKIHYYTGNHFSHEEDASIMELIYLRSLI
jgi:hypothetical protein